MHKNVVKVDGKNEKSESDTKTSSGSEKGGENPEEKGTYQPLENSEVHSENKEDSLLGAENSKDGSNMSTVVKEPGKVLIIKPQKPNKERVCKVSFTGKAGKSNEEDTNKKEAKAVLSPELAKAMEVDENNEIQTESSSESDGQEEQEEKEKYKVSIF